MITHVSRPNGNAPTGKSRRCSDLFSASVAPLADLPPNPAGHGEQRRHVAIARGVMDCGGKRSATPLSCGQWFSKARGSRVRAKAPSPLALCRRTP